jgi:leader peptidase (prepilin peptidase) / N-methyltransferase
MTAFAAVLAGVGGLAFGSFMSVVVHRVPRKESIVAPRSRCPNCGHQLAAPDNIPLVSWVMLGGKCRYCKAPVSPRYLAAEVLTALVWILAVVRLGVTWHLLAYLPFLWVLVALSLIDLETKLLPNAIVYPSIVAGIPLLALTTALTNAGLSDWIRGLAGLAVGAGVFLVIALIYPAGMGMGDVKLAGLIGLFVGYASWRYLVAAFFLAFLAGAAVGVALMVGGKAGRKTAIPFGPFMALGAVVTVLFGDPIVRLYRG